MKKHAAPIIAAVLLLLPVLYVGSYLALVVPEGFQYPIIEEAKPPDEGSITYWWPSNYRLGGSVAERLFWPLERIDRKVRPGAWE